MYVLLLSVVEIVRVFYFHTCSCTGLQKQFNDKKFPIYGDYSCNVPLCTDVHTCTLSGCGMASVFYSPSYLTLVIEPLPNLLELLDVRGWKWWPDPSPHVTIASSSSCVCACEEWLRTLTAMGYNCVFVLNLCLLSHCINT